MLRYPFSAVVTLCLSASLFFSCGKKTYDSDEDTISDGKNLFNKNCSSCHSLEADGIGPPLGGITTILSEQALIDFIRNPSKVIQSGDARAVGMLTRYKQVMPGYDWMKEQEINAILAFIHDESKKNKLKGTTSNNDTTTTLISGRLVPPVKKSELKIELEEIIQIPRLKGTSADLGIVTLRPHPSGDGTLFVSDQNGVIYRISRRQATVFLDVRKEIKDFQSGPGIATGVGSFDFHPDFLNNGLIYITHAETFKGQIPDYRISDSLKAEVQWVIGEWKMDDVKDKVFKGKHREMMRLHAPTFAHGCQDIGFVPGMQNNEPDYGLLYIGYGDGGSNNIKRPQLGHHSKSFLGTVMRIDPAGHNSKNGKYGIPADNPFASEKDPAVVKEIYAYGFRNPHRFTWDSNHGNRLMVTDIGEANIEELNIVEKGGDYGWPVMEGDFGIKTTRALKKVYEASKADLQRYKRPYLQYDHEDGKAISGGYIYEGDLTPLRNKYIFGDIVNGKLFYANIDRDLSDSSVYELTIMENGKETSLQDMSNTKRLHQRVNYDRYNKQLYVITKADGKIRRVSKVYAD